MRRCGRCFLSLTSDPSWGRRNRCSASQRFHYSPHVSDVSGSRGRDLSKICSATSISIAETASGSHYNRSHNRGCFGRWPSLHKVRILYVCINGDVPFHAFFGPRASPESQPLFSPPATSNVFPLCLSCEGVPFGVCSQEKPRSGICIIKCIFICGARARARFEIPRDVSGEWIRHSNFRSTG